MSVRARYQSVRLQRLFRIDLSSFKINWLIFRVDSASSTPFFLSLLIMCIPWIPFGFRILLKVGIDLIRYFILLQIKHRFFLFTCHPGIQMVLFFAFCFCLFFGLKVYIRKFCSKSFSIVSGFIWSLVNKDYLNPVFIIYRVIRFFCRKT